MDVTDTSGTADDTDDQAAFVEELKTFCSERKEKFKKPPIFYGKSLNLLKLWREVIRLGGYKQVTSLKMWRQVGDSFGPPPTCTKKYTLFKGYYTTRLLEYEKHQIKCGKLHFNNVSQESSASVDNQQLSWFKNKVVKEQKSKKALEESYGLQTEKLRKTMVENQVVKLRTKKHHEQNKEEMDSQVQFYREHIQQLYDARNVEEKFEKIQQDEREKVTHSEANGSAEERRAEEISRFIQLQDKGLEEFGTKREKMLEAHKVRMLELKRKHMNEEMAVEEEFNKEFNKLMEEYTPTQSIEPK